MTSGRKWPEPIVIAKKGEPCGPDRWHGSSTGYTHFGCRGDDCRRWNAARKPRREPNANPRARLPGQGAVEMGNRRVVPGQRELVCPCWCERKLLGVPVSLIRAGLTLSCGHPKCG